LFAGGRFGVEKVKPDPLNLLVNTDVGKQIIHFLMIGALRVTRSALVVNQGCVSLLLKRALFYKKI